MFYQKFGAAMMLASVSLWYQRYVANEDPIKPMSEDSFRMYVEKRKEIGKDI